MTRVLINAISIKEGGSLVVLTNLLSEMAAQQPRWQWHLATSAQAASRVAGLPNTTCHTFPESDLAGWKVRLWYETQLPRLARQVNADLLFSQTNYLPSRRLPCPSLLLVQHAGHFSNRFGQLTQAQLGSVGSGLIWGLKGRWVKSSIRRADAVTVQTQALADLIRIQTRVAAERLHVIPHGTGQAHPGHRLAAPPEPGEPARIGYITKYGVQKNFSVLIQAVAELKAAGIPTMLVLTLNPEKSECQTVLAMARQFGILDCLENHGDVVGPELDRLYGSLHMFAYPSWCESFGLPLVEAMAHGLPLLVADTPSNREIAGTAGLAFAPDDASALVAAMRELIEQPAWHQACAASSRDRAARFTWQKAAAETLALIHRTCRPARTA